MDSVPAFLKPLYEGDPELYELVTQGMQTCHAEAGSVPKKYRLLFSMVADGVMGHPEGVAGMARAARAAGATQAEINEAVRIIYLSGGMVALMDSLSAYDTESDDQTG